MVLVTHKYIEWHSGEKGGWSKKQLAALGVDWPPPSGWKKNVVGKRISNEAAAVFESSAKSSKVASVSRINLNCPFEDKDEAKELGARWDSIGKTWFIENIEDITPFERWLTGSKSAPKTTGGKFVPLCNCNVLPWDDCEHTPAYLAMLSLKMPKVMM